MISDPFGWVLHTGQEEPFGRRRSRCAERGVRALEHLRHLRERPPSPGDLDHRPDEVAHHPVQVAVRLDPEPVSDPVPRCPLRRSHLADLAAVGLARPRESPEGATAGDQEGGLGEPVRIDAGVRHVPAPAGPERRRRLRCRAQAVFVCAGRRVKPGVEIRRDPADLPEPDLGGEERVHRPAELSGGPARRHIHGRDLSEGVHSGVGPSGSGDGPVPAGDRLDDAFEFRLYRRAAGLALPALERCAVVLDDEEIAPEARHDRASGRHVRTGAPGRSGSGPPRRHFMATAPSTVCRGGLHHPRIPAVVKVSCAPAILACAASGAFAPPGAGRDHARPGYRPSSEADVWWQRP